MACLCWTSIFSGAVVLILGVFLLIKFIKDRLAKSKLERWNNTPKGFVILHGFPPGKTCPNSPFVLKVQTFMRMAGIKYQTFGPKGQAPWLSFEGTHVADSEFIVAFLKKKFEVDLNKNISKEKLAVASAIRILLDEHFVWGLRLERMVYGGLSRLKNIVTIPLPAPLQFLALLFIKYSVIKKAKASGIGLHSQVEVEEIMKNDLRIVSTILGTNKFICGDEPCEYDAAIFGQLSQCSWGLPDSPYQQLLDGELKNLKEYCVRMKERFWKDWDQCLST